MPVMSKEAILEKFDLKPEDVDALIAKLKALVHEGNVRRLVVRDRGGRTIIEAPLTVGVVGAALIPLWAAVGAIAALAANCTIEVERPAP